MALGMPAALGVEVAGIGDLDGQVQARHRRRRLVLGAGAVAGRQVARQKEGEFGLELWRV